MNIIKDSKKQVNRSNSAEADTLRKKLLFWVKKIQNSKLSVRKFYETHDVPFSVSGGLKRDQIGRFEMGPAKFSNF